MSKVRFKEYILICEQKGKSSRVKKHSLHREASVLLKLCDLFIKHFVRKYQTRSLFNINPEEINRSI